MGGSFQYHLGQLVTIRASGERGEVRGRAEYCNDEPQYYVHYKSADGRAVTVWWAESLLSA